MDPKSIDPLTNPVLSQQRAESMGVKKMVVTGTSIATTTAAQELVKKYEGTLYYTAGMTGGTLELSSSR